MVRYNIGDKVEFRITLRNLAGALATPTALKLVVKPPAGDAIEYTLADEQLTLVSTGVYAGYHVVDAAGAWAYRWESSGDPVLVHEGLVNVVARLF